MAYSRWISSRWYTYWMIPGGPQTFRRDDQVLDVCAVAPFTYKELSEDLEKCLDQVERVCRANNMDPVQPEEREELKGYMEAFLEDVRTDPDMMDPLREDLLKVEKVIKDEQDDVESFDGAVQDGRGA